MGRTKNIIIEAGDREDFEKQLNEVNEKENVFATQTHVNVIYDSPLYTAVLFARKEEE